MTLRLLTFLNTLALVILAAFCARQWHREILLDREINDHLRGLHENAVKINSLEHDKASLEAELEFFQRQYADLGERLDKTEQAMHKAWQENTRLTVERDLFRENAQLWRAASQERDTIIAEANLRLKDFAARLNESITRYNDLVKRHNDLIIQENATRKSLADAYKALKEAHRKLYRLQSGGTLEPDADEPADAAPAPAAP